MDDQDLQKAVEVTEKVRAIANAVILICLLVFLCLCLLMVI